MQNYEENLSWKNIKSKSIENLRISKPCNLARTEELNRSQTLDLPIFKDPHMKRKKIKKNISRASIDPPTLQHSKLDPRICRILPHFTRSNTQINSRSINSTSQQQDLWIIIPHYKKPDPAYKPNPTAFHQIHRLNQS